MSVKIGLDAGHGLNTSGKQTPDGIKEWELNDNVRDKVHNILLDYDVVFVDTDNNEGIVDESLGSRVSKYMNEGVEVFVSIHHNAYTGNWNKATGVEVYVDKNATEDDLRLAECIYKRLVAYTGLKGRGIKRENFYVINQNTIPAVLVEGGFMDSTIDYKVITTESGQDAYARAVAEGLIEFKGLQKKVVAPTLKTVSEVAQEVLQGKWGNGLERKEKLTQAGYDYNTIQAEVNRLCKKETPPTPTVNYFAKYSGTSGSIVTALNSIGATSSFAYRTKIAKANDIKLYCGTAKQNIKMLDLLKQGKLIKP